MSSSRQSGQPPEPTGAERLERGRAFLELKQKYGVSPDTIAEREGLSRALVYRMIAEAARAEADRAAGSPPAPAAAPVQRKMTEATLLRRAWLTMHLHGGLRAADAVARMFWLEAVMAIRSEGDGAALLFGDAGYGDGADFAACFGGTPDALALLVRRRVLLDLGGAGIGLPPALGLLPREKLGGRLVPGVSSRTPDPRQSSMLHLVPGGRSDTETESTGESTKPGHPVDSESTEPLANGHFESTHGGDSVDSPGLAHAAVAVAVVEEFETLNNSNSLETRPSESTGESTKTAPSVDSFVDSNGLEKLLNEVRALAGLGQSASAADLGAVERWLTQHSPDSIRKVVGDTAAMPRPKPIRSLRYFDRAFDDALAARTRPAPGAQAGNGGAGSAPAPEPPDEPITGTGIEAQWARVRRGLGKGIARNWLGKAEIAGIEDGEMTIAVPTPFVRDHIVKNFGDRLRTLWRAENPEIRRVNIEVAAPGARPPAAPPDTS